MRETQPAVATELVIYTILDDQLQVLLQHRDQAPYQDRWALPGSQVNEDEDLDGHARQVLADCTKVSNLYLEQLYTFGDPQRSPDQRVISVSYFALVPPQRLAQAMRQPQAPWAWWPHDALPPLAFDHGAIIALARERLAAKLYYSTIALQFMGAEFTLSELQHLYERVLNEALDKRNFRKWILATGKLEDTGKKRRIGAHRPASLYRAKRPDEVEFIR